MTKAISRTKAKEPVITSSNNLTIVNDQGKTQERKLAEIGQDPAVLNALTARLYTQKSMGEIDVTESVKVMRDKVSMVNSGNITDLEATLTAQAVSLDAIFNELARRSALNMGEYMHAAESYMRLALKAQSQCARTIETLAAIKTPPVVFAKQANISHGHQQVNNGGNAISSHEISRGETVNQQNELLT